MYPIIRNIPINEIIVENRRREDFGDVEGLAESIRRLGLFHPLVVDDKNNLVAGERRLRACKLLGWSEIPVRRFENLTGDERREIELEENSRRKDLTSFEQSKNIVKLAELAAKTLEDKPDTILFHDETKAENYSLSTMNNESQRTRGGQEKPNSLSKVAEKIGIPRPTIIRATNHVEAVRKYPELVAIPTQKDALTIAKNLDALPETELEATRHKLRSNDSDTLTALAEKPPMRTREFASGESPGEKWTKMLYKNQTFLTSISHNGGIDYLWKNWTQYERRAFYQNVRQMEKNFSNLREAMEEKINEKTYSNAQENVA